MSNIATMILDTRRQPPRSSANGTAPCSVRDLLHRAVQKADDDFITRTKGHITPRQWCVLAAVAAKEGLSQTGLVDRTGIDRSTLADIVRRMQRKGLLQRRRTKEDARAYAVKLTDEGKRVLRLHRQSSVDSDEAVLTPLSAKEQGELRGLLERMGQGAA